MTQTTETAASAAEFVEPWNAGGPQQDVDVGSQEPRRPSSASRAQRACARAPWSRPSPPPSPGEAKVPSRRSPAGPARTPPWSAGHRLRPRRLPWLRRHGVPRPPNAVPMPSRLPSAATDAERQSQQHDNNKPFRNGGRQPGPPQTVQAAQERAADEQRGDERPAGQRRPAPAPRSPLATRSPATRRPVTRSPVTRSPVTRSQTTASPAMHSPATASLQALRTPSRAPAAIVGAAAAAGTATGTSARRQRRPAAASRRPRSATTTC